ncbi:MAG: CDP-6-deoxy-delta-3,4-glucoseen reductase [Alphaproteobacteria bacterium]|nr:CDP-6-deoxy-delta-3,4-glucoseen reductase [Alphaproteobacteria bacterium]
MGFRVRLQPSGHEFEAQAGQSILTAGLEAGYAMPYSCRAGTCRTCRGHIREGSVDFGFVHPNYLSDDDKANGLALLCQASALSGLTIEVEELDEMLSIQTREVPCRIFKIDRPAPDVTVLTLRLPMNENMRFLAGQYVDFLLPDGRRRSYSIATRPLLEGVTMIDLHIRHIAGGHFTGEILGALKGREIMRFEGPLGAFYLRDESIKPIIMVASGTGFAPLKAMCEHAFARNIDETRPIALYWGCRSKADFYMLDLPQKWARERENFTFIPVLSEPTPACGWRGRTGFVHEAVMADAPDMSGAQVYACGAPVMVDAARRNFIAQCHLPENEFFADAFLTEAERAAASAA